MLPGINIYHLAFLIFFTIAAFAGVNRAVKCGLREPTISAMWLAFACLSMFFFVGIASVSTTDDTIVFYISRLIFR